MDFNNKAPDNVLTMELTPSMKAIVVDTLDIEIEFMRGTAETLPDGRTMYTLLIPDEKVAIVRVFVLKLISHSHKANMS